MAADTLTLNPESFLGMHIARSIAETRALLKELGEVAFVPTMGNLHEGHLALARLARAHAPRVVASIFVNRLQFGPREDFDHYPRTFAEDCEKLAALGVDLVFAPDEREFYPEPQQVLVEPPPMGQTLEGAFRPGFFRGVATVVLKLFNIVQPRVAVFGKKDFQQLRVVEQMVRQLALPVAIAAGETVREPDGLAMSSRNRYLAAPDRAEASRLYNTLQWVSESIPAGRNDLRALEAEAASMLDKSGWKVDYVAVQQSATLEPAQPGDEELVILGAARLGGTRLIDNLEVCLRK